MEKALRFYLFKGSDPEKCRGCGAAAHSVCICASIGNIDRTAADIKIMIKGGM